MIKCRKILGLFHEGFLGDKNYQEKGKYGCSVYLAPTLCMVILMLDLQ